VENRSNHESKKLNQVEKNKAAKDGLEIGKDIRNLLKWDGKKWIKLI